MTTHDHPPRKCIYCGYWTNTDTGMERPAREGDRMLCVSCGEVAIYTADGERRKPTPEEVEEIEADPRLAIFRILQLMDYPQIQYREDED